MSEDTGHVNVCRKMRWKTHTMDHRQYWFKEQLEIIRGAQVERKIEAKAKGGPSGGPKGFHMVPGSLK